MRNDSDHGPPARRIDGLRLIGLLKIGKAILLLATTYGLYRLLNPDLLRVLHDWINTLTDSFERRLLERGLDWLDTQSAAHFGSIFAVTVLYTALLLTEGIGLWLRKAWAEWFTVVSTSSLIPFELWHLFFGSHHNTLALLGATALNLIIVLYLVAQLRRARAAAPSSHRARDAAVPLMPVKLRRVLLVVLVLAALAWSALQHREPGASTAPWAVTAAAPDVLRLGSLSLEPCTIGKSGHGVPTLRAYCVAFAVPEDRRQPQGRHIRLRVAMVRASAAEADPDPVVFLDGGPGGAASEDYPALAGAFEPLRKRHAVLLIDQRGTGGSNALDCGAGENAGDGDEDGAGPVADAQAVGATARAAAATTRALQQLRACLARLAPRAAPQFYATMDAVADLEEVRRALGAPRLDLIGVSYGTRVAQQYARRYPGAVRAVILDSAVPNDLSLSSETARNLEDTLRALSERCRAERLCAERFGDPYRTLQRVHARLQAGAPTVELRDPYTFQAQRKTITADTLVELVRLYAYSPYTAALLPYVLQEADAGRYAPLLGQARIAVGDVDAQLNGGMGLSVACTEDAGGLHLSAADEATVLGNSLTQWLLNACAVWPHGSRPADFGAPLRGPVPVLILAGEHDPVTPPRYAEAIVRTLPRGRLLRAAGQSHGLLGVGCMPRLLSEFIGSLDAAGLDARCLDVLAQTPSFHDANGAGP